MNDPFNLQRFVQAQEYDYEIALEEIRTGRKKSHCMWFIFPQLRGLGESEISHFFGLSGLDEAKAYLAHPLLSPRLYEMSETLLRSEIDDPMEIFGDIDSMKLRSSMTLFHRACGEDDSVFQKVLNKFFDGIPDLKTIQMLWE